MIILLISIGILIRLKLNSDCPVTNCDFTYDNNSFYFNNLVFFLGFILGLRLKKSVPSVNIHKYFPVNIHGEKLYLHKQTATWYLQEKQQRLSCDRVLRVQVKKVSI